MNNAARPVHLSSGRRTGDPQRFDDAIFVDACELRLGAWEGEVLVAAAGWIAVIRGASLALGLACGFLSIRSLDPIAPWGFLLFAVAPLLVAVHGLGVLRRGLACRKFVLLWAAAALVWFASRLVYSTSAGPLLQVDPLWRFPGRLVFLPAFLYPELFAWWALRRSDGLLAFEPSPRSLPSVLDALRLRPTPRIVLASGALGLAFVSSLAVALLLPGLLLAIWPVWM